MYLQIKKLEIEFDADVKEAFERMMSICHIDRDSLMELIKWHLSGHLLDEIGDDALIDYDIWLDTYEELCNSPSTYPDVRR